MKRLACHAWLFLPLWIWPTQVQSQEAAAPAAFHSVPEELRLGCVLILDQREEGLADNLARAAPDDRVTAARALWLGHSRRHARTVLQFVSGTPSRDDAFVALKQEVENSLRPQAVLRELRHGDYRWGTWLAFLRPHLELVPELLAGLQAKPDWLLETMLALGKSGDRRALDPLLGLLQSKDYWSPGVAAQALGYLAAPETQPKLLAALAQDNSWLQVNACGALAKFGTRQALPALARLAQDDSYTGALNVRGMARFAIDRIKERDEL